MPRGAGRDLGTHQITYAPSSVFEPSSCVPNCTGLFSVGVQRRRLIGLQHPRRLCTYLCVLSLARSPSLASRARLLALHDGFASLAELELRAGRGFFVQGVGGGRRSCARCSVCGGVGVRSACGGGGMCKGSTTTFSLVSDSDVPSARMVQGFAKSTLFLLNRCRIE